MVADGFEFAFDLAGDTDWSGYISELARLQQGIDVPAGWVPASFLVATIDGVVVGRTSIRHQLNDGLLAFGGHIGYCVLPPFRRRGFATDILSQSLIIARAFGVERVLLTCDDKNLASREVIERCGGLLDPYRPLTTRESRSNVGIGSPEHAGLCRRTAIIDGSRSGSALSGGRPASGTPCGTPKPEMEGGSDIRAPTRGH